MKRVLIVMCYVFCYSPCIIYGQESQIPSKSYLIFTPKTANIKDAQLRQAPIKTDKTSFKSIFFEIKYSENSQKTFLLKRSDKKYYKFLVDLFELNSFPINSGKVKPLMSPLTDGNKVNSRTKRP